MDDGVMLPEGVVVTPLKKIHHPKGDVFHALKADEPDFVQFGEAYFTTIRAGDIKGWKKHTHMVMNLVVPLGEVIFYLHAEQDNKTYTVRIGDANYARLTIPAGLWVAFRGVNPDLNLVLNIASIAHDPLEAENVDLTAFQIPGED